MSSEDLPQGGDSAEPSEVIEDPLPLNWKEILGIQVSKHGQTLVGLHAGMAAKLQLYFHYPPTKMQRFLRQKRRPRSTLALARPVMVTPTEIRYFHVPPQRAQFSQNSVSVSEIRGGKTHHWILLANVSTKKHWCYHIPNSLPKKKKNSDNCILVELASFVTLCI